VSSDLLEELLPSGSVSAERGLTAASLLAPILHDLDLELRTLQFNGSFLHANIFRQPAGPDVDAAWESLGINCQSRPYLNPFSLSAVADEV
jgi:hypothetical protein